MRLYARPGMYDDWVAYQAQMRRQRKEALRIKQKEAEELREMLTWIFIVVVIWGGICGVAYWWFFS
jgi:CHASE3 domain sensor protein